MSVKMDTEIALAPQAFDIAETIFTAVSVPAADYKADILRSHLSKLPFSTDETCFCSPSLVEVLLFLADSSLRSEFASLKSLNTLHQAVLMTISGKDGYAKLCTVASWSDIPERMREKVVAAMLREVTISLDAGVRTGKVKKHEEAAAPANRLSESVAISLMFERLFKKFIAVAATLPQESTSLYEGEHSALESLIHEFETSVRGSELPLNETPSMQSLSDALKIRNEGKLKNGCLNLKRFCSVQSFSEQLASRAYDGLDDDKEKGLLFQPGQAWHLQDIQPKDGLGKVSEHNFLECLKTRQNALAIVKFCNMSVMQPWSDTIQFLWLQPDCHRSLLMTAVSKIELKWYSEVTGTVTFPSVVRKYADRGLRIWDEVYFSPKRSADHVSMQLRLSALEGSQHVQPKRTGLATQLIANPAPTPSPAPGKSTMPKQKARNFQMFNLDLLPFDGGKGCAGFLNTGVCDCGGTLSHACPLKSCGGVIHPTGFKLHHNANWRNKPLSGPYAKAPPATPPAGAIPPTVPGKGDDATATAKGKGKGKKK